MIIEFFGPPCVGKTSLASAVAARLREHGYDIRLNLSYRPREVAAGSVAGSFTAPLCRLVRPLAESIVAANGGPARRRGDGDLRPLMELVPAYKIFRSVRLWQYVYRLRRSWHEAAASNEIVLFDQGFVQAVSSAAVAAGSIDPKHIGVALEAVPQADVLVRLHAPREILEKRLIERRDRQGRIERLFDTWANLDSIRIFDQLDELLRAQGREVACLDSSGHRGLQQGAELIETMVACNRGREPTRPAQAGVKRTYGSLVGHR